MYNLFVSCVVVTLLIMIFRLLFEMIKYGLLCKIARSIVAAILALSRNYSYVYTSSLYLTYRFLNQPHQLNEEHELCCSATKKNTLALIQIYSWLKGIRRHFFPFASFRSRPVVKRIWMAVITVQSSQRFASIANVTTRAAMNC